MRKKIRRKMKQVLALLLVFSIAFSYHAETLAASRKDQVISMGKASQELEKEREKEWKQSSVLYNQLLQTSGRPIAAGTSLTDEGADWAGEYKQKVAEAGIGEALDAVKDAASYRIQHIYKRSPNYYDIKGGFSDLANTIESFGSFMGVTDAMAKFSDVLNLQGDTVEEQLLEVAVLTAEFGTAAFSVIGITIGFPYGMILSLVLDLVLDLIRNGALDGLTLSDHLLDKDEFERQRYKLPYGTNVYKPNIYIYSREERKVTVTFGEPELLTAAIPEYWDSWTVTADREGRLTDASGLAYEYLFYESVTEPSIFQTESGWRIPADGRKERFSEILRRLGFNERETADFTGFWTEKLDPDTDYIMFPQGTGLVNLAMPIAIDEAPESLERIWFVFMKDDGRQVKEPAGYELSRGGESCPYYVIEWGGLILDESPSEKNE